MAEVQLLLKRVVAHKKATTRKKEMQLIQVGSAASTDWSICHQSKQILLMTGVHCITNRDFVSACRVPKLRWIPSCKRTKHQS